MRTAPVLAALAAALLAGGALTTTATAAPATATAAAPAHEGGGGVVWGTVVSGGDLNVRDRPDTGAAVVARLAPGSQDRVECATHGAAVFGNPYWYWLTGVRGWVSAAYVDTGGRSVPSCTDPCPSWKDCCPQDCCR